jgi:hypothetical protein
MEETNMKQKLSIFKILAKRNNYKKLKEAMKHQQLKLFKEEA